jgi:glycosyltransferase involved in cell wall biosynthesis
VVDLDRYPGLPPEPAEPFTVGWIGSPTASASLQEIVPALRALQGSGSARLRLVGAGAVALPGVEATVVPWSEAGEAAEIARFHVGVMPLRDDLWSRGKCGYKLIQYMAAARPVVASPVGVNTEIVEDGVNGFLARSPSDWTTALERLRADSKLRVRMGEAGRKRVEDRYNLRVTAPRLANLLREAALRAV